MKLMLDIRFVLVFFSFSVTVCHLELTGCVGLECLHDGTVTEDGGTCHCVCVPGFSGLKCEYELKESKWPSGPYYLPMPKGGCPETKAQGWKVGYINFTTEVPFTTDTYFNKVSNNITSLSNLTFEEIDILGPFGAYNLQMNFCFKSGDHNLTETKEWPIWDIEIFASNEGCPPGFVEDVFVTSFPYLLHWNMDGYVPSFYVRQEPNNRTTEVTFNLCKRIMDFAFVFLDWDMPFLLIKQPFSRCDDTGLMTTYLIYEERYPIYISGLFTNQSFDLPLEFCFYKPVIYSEFIDCPFGCTLYYIDPSVIGKLTSTRFIANGYSPDNESQVLFMTENTKEVHQCLDGLLVDNLEVTPLPIIPATRNCVAMTWIMIDARMSVMVSGIYIYDSPRLTHKIRTTVFIDKFKWGFLNNGAHACSFTNVNLWRIRQGEQYWKCHRDLEGRYATLLFQWESIKSFYEYGEDMSAADFYLAILPPGEHDVHEHLHTPCYTELGMQRQAIQNFQLTASSFEPGYPPHNARPGSGGWCALLTDENPYIQVDLLSITIVDAVSVTNWNETLESKNRNTFETDTIPFGSRSFEVYYATSLSNMIRYSNRSFYIDTSLRFDEPRTFLFNKPFIARYVRLYPVALGKLACLIFELFGCRKSGQPSLYCLNDSSAEMFTDVPLSTPQATELGIYSETSASQCQNKCQNDSLTCSMFEHCMNDTCKLFSFDIFKPFSDEVKLHQTEITARMDRELWEEKTDVCLRRTFICWRDTMEFQFPRFRHKYSSLSSYNMSILVVENQREVLLSPRYPFYYDENQVFQWEINSEKFIKILFLDISLKIKNKCDDNNALDDIILISKTQPDFNMATVVQDAGFNIGYQQNGKNPFIRTDLTTLYIYFWTYDDLNAKSDRGFRAAVYSEENPECGLPDKDGVYKCDQNSIQYASPEFWQIPDTSYETTFIYLRTEEEITKHDFPYIKVVFELFEVSCFSDSQFLINGHWETWNICNLNKPREPILLFSEMEIKFRQATYIDPRYPVEGFRVLVKSIKREDGPLRPPPSFFDELTKECHGDFKDCLYLAPYRPAQELCVDQFSKCYILYDIMHDMSTNVWTWAAGVCEKNGGVLLTLQSRDEMNYIRRSLLEFSWQLAEKHWKSLNYQDISTHIGLFRFTNSEGVVEERWTDGSPLTFSAWSRNNIAMSGKKNCTIMEFTNASNENPWHRTNCDDVVKFFVCERKISKTNVVIDNTSVSEFVQTDMHDIAHILYHCTDDEWIHILSVCNGVTECSNNADELDCDGRSLCDEKHFQCTDGECIHLSRVCDFRQDCGDNSDEFCDFRSCVLGKEFTCANSQCIPLYQVCDAVPHCLDGSDENDCSTCNTSVAFACRDKSCIPLHLTCDMYADCTLGEDEESCNETEYRTCDDVLLGGIRTSGFFLVSEAWAECIFDFTNNTITMNYPNTDWQQPLGKGLLTIYPMKAVEVADNSGYTCYQKYTLDLPIPQKEMFHFLNKGEYPPPVEEYDLQLNKPPGVVSNGLQMSWQLSRNVIFESSYDTEQVSFNTGKAYCIKDLDTAIKHGPNIDVPEFIKTKVSVDDYWLYLTPCGLNLRPVFVERQCVFDIDRTRPTYGCRSLEHLKNCEQQNCSDGYFKCPRSFCIPYHLVCDGRVHCPDGTDETNCSSGPAIQNIVIYFFGKDYDLADAAHNLAAQLYKDDVDIQIFYYEEKLIVETEDGLNIRYKFRTYKMTSVMSVINRYQEEHLVSLNNFETDMSQILSYKNVNDTLSIFLQNRKLTKDEENILDKVDKMLSSKFRFRIERNETSHKKFQITLSQNGTSKHVKINTWKVLRSGGLLFPDIYSANPVCRNAFRCSFSHVCIPLSNVCDGKTQCPHGDDEDLCDYICPKNCTCEGYSASCLNLQYNVFSSLPITTRALDLSHSSGLNGTLAIESNLFFLIELNVSFSKLAFISKDCFLHTINLLTLDLSHNSFNYLQTNIFNGLKFLRLVLLQGNKLISMIEPNAFNGLRIKEITVSYTQLKVILKGSFGGLNLTKLDLSHNSIETVADFAFQYLSVIELDITSNPIKNFGKGMFEGLEGLQRLKTPKYKFCCVRPIYLEEKNCFPHRDEFSSCGDLMRRTSLQFLLWIIGVLAVSGNIFSIVFRVLFDKKRLKQVYGIFVTSLAVSDLLMGIYMLTIAVADSVYRNRYIEEDEHWRSSHWCSLAGVLSTVSSEASVLFICLITVDRLLVIKYPFGSVRISRNLAKSLVIICWIVCLVIAILPIVQSGYFGDQFYSKSAVCLALPLTKDRSAGWLYSIMIFIGFNFITFILIALGQAMIFYEVRHHSSVMKKKSSARRNDLKVARNLLLLVSTDFACWFPIGCIGLLSLNDYTISGEVYAWIAVLVLPINSAINPFLYTVTAIISSKKFNPSMTEQQSCSEFVTGQRSGFLNAYYGMWVPNPRVEFDVYNIQSEVVLQMKPGEVVWLFADIFKSLHLHHKNGLFFKDLKVEHILVHIQPSNTKYGGVKIEQKPVAFFRKSEPKEDINTAGKILRALTKY